MNRKITFTNEEYYHIYNRGTDKREIFSDAKDYERFLLSMDLLNDESIGRMMQRKISKVSRVRLLGSLEPHSGDFMPLVNIVAYCLNPNHYHFILKQKVDRGITIFMHKLGTSYTNYFNKKYGRSGSLFQGPFKAIHIDSNEYLLHLSAYVNKNNFIHGYSRDNLWVYSSYSDYIGSRNDRLCDKDILLGQFKDAADYEKFVDANAEYMKDKKEFEKYLLE